MTETTTEPAVDPDAEPLEVEELEPTEVEPDDDDLEPDDDAQAAPEPDEAPSTQALLEGLEREYSRHRKAIAKALGIDPAEMHECPTCEGVGFTPEAIDAPPALVQDPYTETCSRCAGNGSTKSGASPLGLDVIPCNGCGGSGYVVKAEQPAAGAGFGEVPAGSGYVPPPAPPTPADDPVLAELRSRGYTILEPIVVPQPAPA